MDHPGTDELMNSDIYYKDVQLFKSQYTVDKVSSMLPRLRGGEADDQIVDDMVASAGLKRQDFNVVSYPSTINTKRKLTIVRRIEGIGRLGVFEGISQIRRWTVVISYECQLTSFLSSGYELMV
jgi:hypothetical protein